MISVSSNNAAVCSRLEVNAFCSPWISPCLFLYYYGESRIPLRGLKFRHFVRNFWPCLEREFLFADDLRHRYPRDLVTSISP